MEATSIGALRGDKMNNRVKRKSLIIALFVCIFASFVGFSITKTSQKAIAENAWQTGVFEMEDGVSLKLSNNNGLRFIVKMDKGVRDFIVNNDDSVELGFVIAPEQLMTAANGNYLEMEKKVKIVVDKNKIYQEGNYYLANGCLTSIRTENYNYKFVAVAYLKQDNTIRYTEYNNNARNSLYSTVNTTFANGYASEILEYDCYSSWYGTNNYPIVVDTTAEYDSIVSLVDSDGVDLSSRVLVVVDETEPTKGFENQEKRPTIFSEELFNVIKSINEAPSSLNLDDGSTAVTMIPRIKDAEKAYNALNDNDKANVDKDLVEKLNTLLGEIKGYSRVYKNDATDGTVIPSYLPGGYSSTVGGTATTRQDSYYGNVLTVTSATSGRASLHFKNFPDVSNCEKIYFYVRILNVSCDIYLSDGVANDGWGLNYKNTWSTSGFWCNANIFRLIEIDVNSDGFIGKDFALGFRTEETGIVFEITDFFGYSSADATTAELSFGNRVSTGETNEHGEIFNISREQWYVDNNNVNTIGMLQQNKLANALPAGCEYFYFWMYNGTGMEYNFHLAGDVSGAWTDSADSTPLKVGEWTKVTISSADIELNKNGQWYVYILGGDGQGATKDGWKISTIYAGPTQDVEYTDHADVKEVIAQISKLPSKITLNDADLVQRARDAYDALTVGQQSQVTNLNRLTSAERTVKNYRLANEVIALIDAINPRDIDATLVKEAREAFSKLPSGAQSYVTNLSALEAYEEEVERLEELLNSVNAVNDMIANLPDSVIMPDHLVFVTRIEKARDAYSALTSEAKAMVENYAKLRSLVGMIRGYETVHVQSVDSVKVISSYVPNYTSNSGGTATMDYHSYYGDFLKVTGNSSGIPAIQFVNFPDVSQYAKIYFNIRVVGDSCNVYISDGISNDGWGDNWKNNWSMDGYWANNGNWIQKEINVSTGIITSNWALGLITHVEGISFEITNIIGWAPDLGDVTGLAFGQFADTGTTNEYGTVYNLTQGWSSETDLGAFNQNVLSGALKGENDSLHFWIYNPNTSAVDFNITGDMNSWNPEGEYLTSLPAGVWTEVILTPNIIEEGNDGMWFITVSSGASTAGWQISPIYAYNSVAASEDIIDKIQNMIDGLDSNNIDEVQLERVRQAYLSLSEKEKELVDIANLTACEEIVGINDSNFIVDKSTEYVIFIDQTDDQMKSAIKVASAFLVEQLEDATGVKLTIKIDKPTTITKYRHAIVIGHRDLYEALGLEIPNEELGEAGYFITKTGRVVFIEADGQDGYRMAILAFLKEVIGYDMISEDCIVYGKQAETLPEFDIVYKPSFEYRQQANYMTEDELYGMGIQAHTDIWIPSSEGWDMHNALHYLPLAAYGTAHPNWYTADKTQICPTAGGNSSEFKAMVKALSSAMMARINAYPNLQNINLSIADSAGNDACTCARCKLYITLYGEAGFSAAWIDLINAVNASIQAQLEDRVVYVSFLAYRSTEGAPANDNYTLKQRYVINDDGSYYLQTDAQGNPVYLKCDDKVAVWFAPIDAKFAENLNHADNAKHLANAKKWCAISERVYVWLYGANFKFSMYPYNSWQSSAENYKILSDIGVDGVWSYAFDKYEFTAFTDLKTYIDSKFTVNVNEDYQDVLNTYFANYFGPASVKMRSMFDSIVAKCNEIESKYDGLGRGIYDELENVPGVLGFGTKTYWEKSWLEGLVDLCDEAIALVDADATLTDVQKTMIKDRIIKESLFPRYVLCTTFASKYSSSVKKQMRQEFKADADRLGFTHYREANGSLSSLYSDWGI